MASLAFNSCAAFYAFHPYMAFLAFNHTCFLAFNHTCFLAFNPHVALGPCPLFIHSTLGSRVAVTPLQVERARAANLCPHTTYHPLMYCPHRWASSCCFWLHSKHEQLCSSQGQHARHGWDDESQVPGAEPPTAHSSITALYCSVMGGARQAAVWVLQTGVNVAAKLGMAIDEVAAR